MASIHDPEWDFPKLRASFGFEDDHKFTKNLDEADTEFFDVKFYPYDPVGSDPVFAAVSKKHVVICRLSQTTDSTNPCEIIRVIRDDDPEALNCSCCWSKEAGTDRALLCVAGRDAKIKVYNVREGKLAMTFVGHGGEINDLATSPDNPRIIASASDDTTVRLWSLDPVHARQPCVCLLGGEGHSWSLLSAAFHSTGRYLLSAGHDQVINLWTIPDLPEHHIDSPIVVHYPHFSTSEVHYGLIDCVAFYGDLILSRACHEEKIVLWKIEGFSSEDPPPSPSIAPTNYDQARTTRSAFAPPNSPSCPSQWMRLLQFETKNCGVQFFLRFSLHHVHGQHPILCFCNARNEIMMWDMSRLTAYQDFINSLRDPDRDPKAKTKIARPAWLAPAHYKAKKAADPALQQEYKIADAAAIMRPVDHEDPFGVRDILLHEYTPETVDLWKSRYDIGNPFNMIKPHKSEGLNGPVFVGRQVAWSQDGCWCVVVGSRNHAVIFQRWGKGARNSQSRQNSHVPSEARSRQGTAAATGFNDSIGSTSSRAQPNAYM